MDNKIKATEDFFENLRLAILFPDRESEDPLVRFILGPFQERFIADCEKRWQPEFAKLSIQELNDVNNEVRRRVEKFCKGILEGSGMERFIYILSKEFLDLSRHITAILFEYSLFNLALYVVSFREIDRQLRLNSTAKVGPYINPQFIAAYQWSRSDTPYANRVRCRHEALGSDLRQDLHIITELYILLISKEILKIGDRKANELLGISKDSRNKSELKQIGPDDINNEILVNEFGTIFHEVLEVHCDKRFAGSSDTEITSSMWDKESGYLLYNEIKRDSINEAESYLANENGMTIKEWREYRKAEQDYKKVTAKGEKPPDELMQRYKELKQKRISRISISHTQPEDSEAIPTEVEPSNEMVEYFIKTPEENAIAVERRKEVHNTLQDWAGNQPKQAYLAREIVEYMIRALNNVTADHKEVFKVTKIAEALNTDKKEVRRVLNKIKEELPALATLLN